MSDVDPTPLPSGGLAAFVAAMEAGSMHGAAQTLELTQSAVTKRVQALEQRVGTRLLERGRFGVRATEAGRVLYPEARAALAALAAAERALRSHADAADRVLTVAASHTVGEFLLPAWLAGFRGERPDVAPQVDIANSPSVLAAVRGGAVHVGFVEGVDDVTDLDSLVVARDELVVVVDAAHRWAHRTTLAARELAAEPYVAREPGSGTRAVATAALAAAGVTLAPHLQMASAQAMKRALAGGAGFALMSALAVEDELRAGTLRAIHLRDLPLTRELHAVRTRDTPTSTAARALWTWLTTHAAPAPAPDTAAAA